MQYAFYIMYVSLILSSISLILLRHLLCLKAENLTFRHKYYPFETNAVEFHGETATITIFGDLHSFEAGGILHGDSEL